MKVIFDGDGEMEFSPVHEGGETVGHALNYVKVVIDLGGGRERHVKVTDEGVSQEIIAENGAVLDDTAIEHEELLPS